VQGKIFRSSIEKANGFIYRLLHDSRLQVDVKGDVEVEDIPRMLNLEGFLHPFDRTKPHLSRWGREARLRVNLEQAPAFNPGSREVHSLSATDADLWAAPESLSGRAGVKLTLEGDLRAPFRFLYQGTCELSKVRYNPQGFAISYFPRRGNAEALK